MLDGLLGKIYTYELKAIDSILTMKMPLLNPETGAVKDVGFK